MGPGQYPGGPPQQVRRRRHVATLQGAPARRAEAVGRAAPRSRPWPSSGPGWNAQPVRLLQVEAEHLLHLEGAVAGEVGRLRPPHEALVQLGARPLQQPPVRDVADHRVREAVVRGPVGLLDLLHHLPAGERAQVLRHGLPDVVAGELPHRPGGELLPRHRRRLQHGALAVGQLVERGPRPPPPPTAGRSGPRGRPARASARPTGRCARCPPASRAAAPRTGGCRRRRGRSARARPAAARPRSARPGGPRPPRAGAGRAPGPGGRAPRPGPAGAPSDRRGRCRAAGRGRRPRRGGRAGPGGCPPPSGGRRAAPPAARAGRGPRRTPAPPRTARAAGTRRPRRRSGTRSAPPRWRPAPPRRAARGPG